MSLPVRVAWLAALFAVHAACLPPDAVYGRPCDVDDDCAGGGERDYVCRDGSCVRADAVVDDGGARPDAGVDDAGVVDAGTTVDGGAHDAGAEDAGPIPVELACADLSDDDGDGRIDCADDDCASSALCVAGDGALASPCTAATACSGDDGAPLCLTEVFSGVPGGACATWCTTSLDDCAPDARCVALDVAPDVGACLPTCASDADCALGLVCRPRDDALVCLAPPCVDDDDCPHTATCDALRGACVETPVCGDGALQLGESCDDGNLVVGDGCGATCAPEGGYACDEPGAACRPIVCGDGLVDAPEPCDDGNTTATDGCTAACTVGSGYICVDEPSRCRTFPEAWRCFPFDFGDGVCDCGCGAIDIDCPIPMTNDDCERGCGGGLVDPFDFTACVPPACGNGLREALESCDDGNTAAGDGCDGACAIETGYSCAGSPSVCVGVPVTWTCPSFLYQDGAACDCGCGTVDSDCEAPLTLASCDRVNCVYGTLVDDDAPHQCFTPPCGDGVREGIEQCDDGNTTGGDGCADSCFEEPGFTCSGTPSSCAPIACGDGLVDFPEQCDDGNVVDGDGCSAACAIEAGAGCGGEPSVCVGGWTCTPTYYADTICDCGCGVVDPDCADVVHVAQCYDNCAPERIDPDDFTRCLDDACGDGHVGVSEACDDGDVFAGDGCDAACVVEPGFVCVGAPSWCRPIVCGDGAVDPGEACDDGDATASDGCTACAIDDGFGCVGSPSSCVPIVCGDGIIAVGESCDDGNTVGGDGCSAGCVVEPNATCSGEPSVCRVVPPEWTCPPQFYDNDDGCDCGCAIVDPDCPSQLASVCEFCSELGSCNTQPGCPGDVALFNNALCAM